MSGYIGRDSATADLRGQIDQLTTGIGQLLLVTGEAGIGKTTLISEAARYGRDRGVPSLWATCWDGDGAPAYWPWVQILREHVVIHGQLSDDVARIMPQLAGGEAASAVSDQFRTAGRGAAEERFALFDDVVSLLVRDARDRPVMIVLDDLQWADTPSLLLLDQLASRIRGVPMLVIGMYRDDEVDPTRRELLAGLRRHAEITGLAGLSDGEVVALMTAVAGVRPAADLAAAVHQRTGGNPFFVREVTQLMASRGDLDSAVIAGGIPDGVRSVLRQRLARLSQACASLLTVAAAAGPEVGTDLLGRAAELPMAAVTARLTEAVRAGVLAPPSSPAGPYRFAHDLFRETLYDEIPSGARARLHGQLGEALEAMAGDRADSHPAELAAHFLLAALGQPTYTELTEKAVRYAESAASAASHQLAYEDAVSHYSRVLAALDLAGLLGDRAKLSLLLGRADALRFSGDFATAGADYAAATELARRVADGDQLARSALGVHALGVESGAARDNGIALLEDALDTSGDTDTALKARVLAALARELFLAGVGDRVRAAALSRAAVEIARRVGDYGTLAGCLLAAHDTLWLPGQAARRRAIAVEMGAAARRAGDRTFEAEACLLRASAGLELADSAGLRDLDEFCRLADALGQPHYRYLSLTRRAMRATLTGHFDQAEQLIDEAELLAEAIGEPDTWNVQIRLTWELRSAQGRRALVESRLRTCSSPQLMVWFDGLVGLALLERGNQSEARRLILPAVATRGDESAMPYIIGTQWAELGEAAAALGLTGACQRYYDALRPYVGTVVVVAAAVGFAGAVDHHLGVLASALGRADDAVAHLERAVVIHQRLSAWPWLARSRIELLAVLVARDRRHDRERIETLTEEVIEAADELDMPGLSRRLELINRPVDNVFARDGDTWQLSFAGRMVRVRHTKGLADIAALVQADGREIPATVLAGLMEGIAAFEGDAILDHQAQREYSMRLATLDADLAEATTNHDLTRASSIGDERAFLVRQLSAAVGLGRRDRLLGDERERARKAVAARIKDAIRRIDAEHPPLGAHLSASIVTGHFLAYRPPTPLRWHC